MLFGDWVAQVTKKIGVKPCIPCQARQDRMNQAHLNLKAKLQHIFGSSGQPPAST